MRNIKNTVWLVYVKPRNKKESNFLPFVESSYQKAKDLQLAFMSDSFECSEPVQYEMSFKSTLQKTTKGFWGKK